MNTTEENTSHAHDILQSIKDRHIAMRPRWYFVLRAALYVVGGLLAFFVSLYLTSLIIFLVKKNGLLFAPSFGARGWLEFLTSLPWILVVITVIFFVLLQQFVQRYQFAYRRPLLVSLFGVIVIAGVGSYIVEQAQLHQRIYMMGHDQVRPSMTDQFYHLFDVDRFRKVHRGQMGMMQNGSFIIFEPDGDRFPVEVSSRTVFPNGMNIASDTDIVVFGEFDAGTIHAIGVRPVNVP